MNWNDLIKLDASEFINKLSRRPASLMRYENFIDLYNSLMHFCEINPSHSAALADVIAPFLRRRGLRRHALLFDELSARACILSGEFSNACRALITMIEADRGEESCRIVLELAEGIAATSHTFGMSIDHGPEVLAAVSTVFSKLGKREQLADVHLKAAGIYSHHGAFQAAYRSISDAEEIAHEIRNSPLLARALVQAASVACLERDYKWSLGASTRALSIYEALSAEPPVGFWSNFALAQLHTNNPEDALLSFRIAAERAAVDSAALAQIKINIATCFRLQGDYNNSAKTLESARSLMPSDAPFEAWIELEIVSARLALVSKDSQKAASYLSAAAEHLEIGLENIYRLHHRRGLREQYIERFESILRELPMRGTAEAVLPALASIRGNALGDWLILLDWVYEISREDITVIERRELNEILDRLRRFGVPHLFGYHEKYDDAWQPWNEGSGWDDLSKLARKLSKKATQKPFEAAKLLPTVTRLQDRLAKRHALVTVTYAGEDVMFWIVFADQYIRVKLPTGAFAGWRRAQFRYSVCELSRGEYAKELCHFLDVCGPVLQSALSELAEFEPKSIQFLRDHDGSLPFTSLILENELLENAVAEGLCELRIVPALVFSREDQTSVPRSIVAIHDSSDDLLLPKFEGEAIATDTGMLLEKFSSSKAEKPFADLIGNAESLIVSTHGQPLRFFTDAIFAGMDEGHIINVATLQEEAAGLNLKLVILNSCYSGTASSRNFQKEFRTSDAVTLPSLFLLNRQAVVSASLWRVSDTVSYIYAALVGNALKRSIKPALALSSSVAAIKRLTKNQAISILQNIPDPEVRETAIARLLNAPDVGLFSRPYLYGAIALFGLL